MFRTCLVFNRFFGRKIAPETKKIQGLDVNPRAAKSAPKGGRDLRNFRGGVGNILKRHPANSSLHRNPVTAVTRGEKRSETTSSEKRHSLHSLRLRCNPKKTASAPFLFHLACIHWAVSRVRYKTEGAREPSGPFEVAFGRPTTVSAMLSKGFLYPSPHQRWVGKGDLATPLRLGGGGGQKTPSPCPKKTHKMMNRLHAQPCFTGMRVVGGKWRASVGVKDAARSVWRDSRRQARTPPPTARGEGEAAAWPEPNHR